MKKIAFILILVLSCIATKAQTIDERIGAAINSSDMNLLTAAETNQQPMLIKLDSGDSSYGRLNKAFFEANKDYLTSQCQSDTVNQAGVGGVWSVLCYKLQDATLTIGGNTVKLPSIQVQTEQQENHYMDDNNLGLMKYDAIP